MKTEIIRSGEKGFEEEKAKMLEITRAVPKIMPTKKPRVLTKEEQLEKVFPTILSAMLVEYDLPINEKELKEKYTRILLREVKARVNLK